MTLLVLLRNQALATWEAVMCIDDKWGQEARMHEASAWG